MAVSVTVIHMSHVFFFSTSIFCAYHSEALNRRSCLRARFTLCLCMWLKSAVGFYGFSMLKTEEPAPCRPAIFGPWWPFGRNKKPPGVGVSTTALCAWLVCGRSLVWLVVAGSSAGRVFLGGFGPAAALLPLWNCHYCF